MYHIIRQLSYRVICEIMTWSDDKTKLIHKNISTRLRLRALKPYEKNENPHHNNKGAYAVKTKSEVPHSGTIKRLSPLPSELNPKQAVHDDVIKWKHFLRYWPLVRGIHRSPVGQLENDAWLWHWPNKESGYLIGQDTFGRPRNVYTS